MPQPPSRPQPYTASRLRDDCKPILERMEAGLDAADQIYESMEQRLQNLIAQHQAASLDNAVGTQDRTCPASEPDGECSYSNQDGNTSDSDDECGSNDDVDDARDLRDLSHRPRSPVPAPTVQPPSSPQAPPSPRRYLPSPSPTPAAPSSLISADADDGLEEPEPDTVLGPSRSGSEPLDVPAFQADPESPPPSAAWGPADPESPASAASWAPRSSTPVPAPPFVPSPGSCLECRDRQIPCNPVHAAFPQSCTNCRRASRKCSHLWPSIVEERLEVAIGLKHQLRLLKRIHDKLKERHALPQAFHAELFRHVERGAKSAARYLAVNFTPALDRDSTMIIETERTLLPDM